MNSYIQLTSDERATIGALLCKRFGIREIARVLGRSPSTVSREIRRNRYSDGSYKAHHARSMTSGRRRRARHGTRFTKGQLARVEALIRQDYSPEQVSGYLRRTGVLSISHESIYLHLIADKSSGGDLYKHLRCARKKRRKRYGAYDSRGRVAGKRTLDQRPPGAVNRSRTGHWEIDTVLGSGRACILTVVDRRTGYLQIGKLPDRTADATNEKLRQLIERHHDRFLSITADNGCEFHRYLEVEESHGVPFYFAPPYHSWERGTNENTNGLIRQYLPKGTSMDDLTQTECDMIARKINHRPRKRHGYYSPAELFS